MRMKQTVTPELRVAPKLNAHEKDFQIRYASVEARLTALNKHPWRLKAMFMGNTLIVCGLAVSLLFTL